MSGEDPTLHEAALIARELVNRWFDKEHIVQAVKESYEALPDEKKKLINQAELLAETRQICWEFVKNKK